MSKQFKEEINMSWEASSKTLLNFYANHLDIYEAFDFKVRTQYPRIYDELRGYADGSGLPFHYIFLLNLIEDLNCYWDNEGDPTKTSSVKDEYLGVFRYDKKSGMYMKQCSDIHCNNDIHHVIGHNEDTGSLMRNISFLADLKLYNDENSADDYDHFVSYIYPGWLPGIAFGYNRHGLTFSNNGVYPVHCYVDIPKTVINREAYSATSFSDLLYRTQVNGYPRSYGTSMNIGSIWGQNPEQYLLESAPKIFGVFEIDENVGNYSHFNNYRLLNIDFRHDGSSVLRLEKMNSLPPVKDKKDVLDRLGTEPIYNRMTVASALYDLDERMIHIYDDNPSTTKPVNSYSLVLE